MRAAWQILSDPLQRNRVRRDASASRPTSRSRRRRPRRRGRRGRRGARLRSLGATASSRRARRARRRAPRRWRTARPACSPRSVRRHRAGWPPGLHPPPPRARLLALLVDGIALLVIVRAADDGREPDHRRDVPEGDRAARPGHGVPRPARDRERRSRREPADADDEHRACQRGVRDLQRLRRAARARRRTTSGSRTRSTTRRATSRMCSRSCATTSCRASSACRWSRSRSRSCTSSRRPSARGRTLGKKLLQLRLVNLDGSPVRTRGAMLHYGVPVMVALLFAPILGPLGYVAVLFGVLTWPRNANYQGLHDRLRARSWSTGNEERT